MLCNVYDFDNTIYAGDSTTDFYRYCLLRHPRMWLELPVVAWMGLGMATRRIDKTCAKERIYRFLRLLPDVEAEVTAFWRTHRARLKPWYLAQRADTDVIISASPEFLLAPVCRELNVTLMASRVDAKTGAYTGVNCHGEEKVRRLFEALPACQADAFYSDSLSDAPLAKIARRAFLVKGMRILPWPAR